MAKLAWLDRVSIPPQQIHPMPTHCVNIEKCVEEYTLVLNTMPKQNGIPCFDLILLGMGDDGHTASLFPDTPVLQETQKWLASVHVAKLDSRRITFTYPLINNALEIIVLVTGANKAEMLKRVLHEPAANLPIQHVRNRAGVHWFVDAAAAAGLV
jgi:6-phosphogluconolactonase